MNLWQIDILKRIAYSPNPSGYYYWTSVYYIDRDLFGSNAACWAYVFNREELITTVDVERMGYRVHDPPGRGNVILEAVFTTPSPGGLPSLGDPMLINIARWRLYSDTGRYSYRLNRSCLYADDIDGQVLSADGYLRQVTALNTFLFPGRFRNSYGELLTSGEVARPVTMWQLRHGTKRRERNPLL